MQHTLIRSVDAENAVNRKVDDMEDLVNQNDELTDEENKQRFKLSRNIKMKLLGILVTKRLMMALLELRIKVYRP